MADGAELVFTPLEQFAEVDEPGAEPLARASEGGTVIPAGGLVLVYGDGGAGKTTLALDLVFALAAGLVWLGLVEPDRKLRAAVIENEGPRQEFRKKVQRKLDHHGADRLGGRIVVLEEPWAGFSFADEPQRRTLAAAIDEGEIDLLVVGPLVSVGMLGGGTPDEIRAFEQLLLELRALVRRPFAILLVHHENRAGQVSGAWERVPDTLIHVTGQGHGRTRLFWQKARWAGELHGTTTQLTWAEGESFTVEDKREPVSADAIAAGILAAALALPGGSWTKLRELHDDDGRRLIRGTNTKLEDERERLLAAGTLVNAATREGHFELWHHDDPACPRSAARTDPERLPFAPAAGGGEPTRSPVRSIRENGQANGTAPEPQMPVMDEFPASDADVPF